MNKHIGLYILLLALFSACYERNDVFMGEVVEPSLSNSLNNSSFVITQGNLNDPFELFSWTAASFGFNHRNPDYVLQMSLAGDNFENAISFDITDSLHQFVSNTRINRNLLTMGATPGQPVNVEFRLTASISPDLTFTSNIVRVSLTPFEAVIEFPRIYLAGDHNSWSFTDTLFSVLSNNIYEGYIWMDNGTNWTGFKMSRVPAWEEADVIGDPNASGTSGTLQVGNWGGNNIFATQGIGYYRIVANLNNNTIQITLTNWAITGDFNSWSFTPMVFDIPTNTWSLTANFTAGVFKFIANQDWTFTFGDDEMDGVLNRGTDHNNIRIEQAGSYTIILNLRKAPYRYRIIRN